MININGVTKAFEKSIAINNLTLEIGPGVTGLVGHNGAGKTTLLRLIADVYECTSGNILIDGKSNALGENKSNLFFLSDDPYYDRNSTISDVFEFYSMFYSINAETFRSLVIKFELPGGKKISTFSKGMKRQLFIALTLSMNCKYILMDEAFDGIDPMVLELIKDEIIKIVSSEEKTLILSSHNMSLIERLCDKLIILDRGIIGQNGNMEDIGTNYFKYQCFFNKEVTKESLEELGIEIIFFKKNGSLINFVSLGEVDETLIKENFETILFETIPIEHSEIIAIEMMATKIRTQKLNGGERDEEKDIY